MSRNFEIWNDPLKTEVTTKQQKEFKKLGSITLRRGHTLFACDTQTFECVPAILNDSKTMDLTNKTSSKSTVVEKNKIYFSALNAKNAKIKLLKFLKFIK